MADDKSVMLIAQKEPNTENPEKKDLYDPATVHFAADDMIKVCEEGPVFEPKFIFYKTDNWKNIDKESQKAFEFLIKSFKKNIEVFDMPSYFKEIPKYHQIIHEKLTHIDLVPGMTERWPYSCTHACAPTDLRLED